MKILVFGSNGQVGKSIRDIENTHFEEHNLKFFSKEELDISNSQTCREVISAEDPSLIINAAAYTAVDNAEIDHENAHLINNVAVRNIANICKDLDVWLVHISTDYVFDGNEFSPYDENSLPNPQTVYGISKLKGEHAIKNSGCKYIILRTSWVFSEYGSNFLISMINLAKKRDTLKIVSDQIGCPTFAQDIAITTSLVLKNLRNNQLSSNIYHYSGDIQCSWFEFAGIIFSEASKIGFQTPSKVIPIQTSEFPTLAERPKYSVLKCSKIKTELNIKPSDWRKGVKKALKNLK